MTGKSEIEQLLERAPRVGSMRAGSPIPDPSPEPVEYRVFSVDDHLVEPPGVFEGRLPAKFRDVVPRVVETGAGTDAWVFEDVVVDVLGGSAPVSWKRGDRIYGPVRFDEYRENVWNVHGRVRDMDLAGVVASLCFPSDAFGFCGHRFMRFKDCELGLASMKAYNEWLIEEWVGAYPDRFVACQVPWLLDVELAAEEIRRNAAKGFTSVTFSENPEKLGLPSIHTGYWDPFLSACAETQTVVNLHVGSSSHLLVPSSDSPAILSTIMFLMNAYSATADWLFSGVAARYPDLKIVMSESGIGWVPELHQRLDYQVSRGFEDVDYDWQPSELTPSELLSRNFWFTFYYDPIVLKNVDLVGEDRIMCEVDYPHKDSMWPDVQRSLHEQFDGLSDAVIAKISYENASSVYRHAMPSGTSGGQ